MQPNRIIELPQSAHSRAQRSFGSSGSSRVRRAGESIIAAVPKITQDQAISIPTGFEQPSTYDFTEEFCFGSPQKRQRPPSYIEQEDSTTQDGTPEKDVLYSHMHRSPSQFTSMSNDSNPFSDHSSQSGSHFHRDVYEHSSETSYELVSNTHVGRKTSNTTKKTNKRKSDEMVASNPGFESLFSNQMILTKQASAAGVEKLDQFKKTEVFRLLRDLNSNFDDLELREDEEAKFDFESESGNQAISTILKLIEKLQIHYRLKKNDRSYRQKFSKAYNILYSQHGGADSYCYLQEILDSAQENFPHLWVNGEKYVFSEDVIQAGDSLFRAFLSLRDHTSDLIDKKVFNQDPNFDVQEQQLRHHFAVFDQAWTQYEQYYVYELMVIESDARRFVTEAIQIERELQELEHDLDSRGLCIVSDKAYNEKREQLITQMSQINTVTNENGKGRDDLTDVGILQAAEMIPNILLVGQAQSVQVLADKIRQCFNCFRVLLRKYSENVDALDPQLKNNRELAELIEIYESSWTLGKEQLQDSSTREQLISFCLNIQDLCSKYDVFKEQVECSEAEIFLSVPTLMVLKSIQNDKDSMTHQNLCSRFAPNLDLASLQSAFMKVRGDKRDICRQLEQFIINDDEKWIKTQELLEFGQKLKPTGMDLSRNDAQAFNGFITAALGE